ncbi:MAG: group III truncated hemoglobin [Microthrixaceae bacterium]
MSRQVAAPAPPRPRCDLASRAQVHDLVVDFYREIVFDDVLAPIFEEVAEVDWAAHIPRLIDYWCRILFGTMDYAGAVSAAHRHLHQKSAIGPEHCDRWHELWVAAVDRAAVGPTAEHAKAHAATLMAGMARHIFGYGWTPPSGRPEST